jgi:hypothetical protein
VFAVQTLIRAAKTSYTAGTTDTNKGDKRITMRYFCTTGLCVPGEHYMVDISEKITQIRKMVDRGLYFTINRARQYGKTTTLSLLRKNLSSEYICLRMSFEGLGDESFENSKIFCVTFMELVQRALRYTSLANDEDYSNKWMDLSVENFNSLSAHISKLCKDKKIVLTIDEVDKTSNNRVYIHFLGMLRDLYLARNEGEAFTFHSVILASVYDIKNIKLKMIHEGIYTPAAEEDRLYNSPWNIAADFAVDMSFNPNEIATMLNEYEHDHHTGMDIPLLSQEIYNYTSGYPFLVSRVCQLLDEKFDKDWTIAGLINSIKYLTDIEKNTLSDDIIKNLESYSELHEFMYELIMTGREAMYSTRDPVVEWVMMFGIVQYRNDKVKIANRIFERWITDYFLSKDYRAGSSRKKEINGVLKFDVVKNGRFNMELCLARFAQHYKKIFKKNDAAFLERQGRMIFLSFLVPLINGEGFYYIESETADAGRMDIVVTYGKEEFIIELKIWHGEEYRRAGLEQLKAYLRSRNAKKGYLLTFDFRKESNRAPQEEWLESDNLRILDILL